LENWMGSLSTLLENKKISEIVIPGTHNSGSYPISVGSRITDRSELSHILGEDSGSDPRIMDLVRAVGPGWSKCQEHSIADQLMMGNRYLDLRVYCDKETDEYYLEHFFIGSNLTDELLHIAQFVDQHPEELVILDIKSVQNCSHFLVTRLFENIGQLFQDKLARPPDVTESLPTYGQLVADGTTVVVALANNEHHERFDWLWDRNTKIDDLYANTASIEELKTYITRKMSRARKPRALFISQIILTATADEYIAGLTNSGPADLRELALRLNKEFLRWIKYFRQMDPTIFITDFPDEVLLKKVIGMNFDQKKEKKREKEKIREKEKSRGKEKRRRKRKKKRNGKSVKKA